MTSAAQAPSEAGTSCRTLTTLAGNRQRLDGGAMFGNAPKALWQRWMAPDEHNRILLGCRALLVREGERNILVETGIGAFFDPALKERYGVEESGHVLLDRLAEQGLSDADIDVVVLTHLHFDHAGGLLAPWAEGEPLRLLFPKARFVTGQRQWLRARSPHARDRASYIPELLDLLEASGRLELLADGATSDTLGPDWRFHVSDGHTPGQLLPEVAMPNGPSACTTTASASRWSGWRMPMRHGAPSRLRPERATSPPALMQKCRAPASSRSSRARSTDHPFT